MNHSGSDDMVKLWNCQDGDCNEICNTKLNYQEQIGSELAPKFKLVWSREGKLKLYFTKDPMGEPLEQIGSCLLDSLPGGRQVVIRYEYSSSQDRNLWIDEMIMEGRFVSDTLAPYVLGVEVLDELTMAINFSESVILPACQSFRLSGSSTGRMNPDTVMIAQHGVVLKFPGIVPNREEHQLWIEGICDRDANCMKDTLITCLRNDAEWGDVVFNELMVDPTPVVFLPEEEYMEIFNRSDFEVDLSGWRVEVNDRSYSIDGLKLKARGPMGSLLVDEPPFKLWPDSYVVITGISLPNEGATLALFSEKDVLIHAVRYEIPWNGLDWKKEGGWSLESPDPHQLCNIAALWEYSSNPKGGTPGITNSNDTELEDITPPIFLYPGYGKGLMDQSGVVRLHYSEPVSFTPQDLLSFKVQPGNIVADSLTKGSPMADQLDVCFPENLHDRLAFKVQFPALADCAGNLSHHVEFRAGRVSELHAGCVLINEIMYDPVEGAPEYIELYIPGNGFYDLRDLAMDVVSDDSSPISPTPLSDHSRIISPGEYLVVTRNLLHLMDAYNLELSGRWIGVKEMRGMVNSGGAVTLTDRAGSVVDRAFYGDQMHMELIDVTRGISLERISTERSGIVLENWHSAASIEGYSTPGRENSQAVKESRTRELILVKPKVFSPDNDGFQDQLEITVSPEIKGWIINMWITGLTGKQVWSLANNHIAGTSVTYTWNGTGGDGRMAGEGIYVLHARGYHPITGESWMKKEAFGLIYP